MLRRGHLTRPYRGIADAFGRVLREEGAAALWRGNQANVIRYFPTQAFNFAFKGYFKSFFGYDKEKDGKWKCVSIVGITLYRGMAGAGVLAGYDQLHRFAGLPSWQNRTTDTPAVDRIGDEENSIFRM
ncbi:hypothetical protein E2562_019700 [Oryza meyeriana var. granulata]|uniref:ADP/ATP translocase n=1 Tax=Oryza meyeriana var. granulata TaxID=110450 RepID=A0A6G1C8A1_9ORYZ|nr:hypothetical protein E2562_019700 [Oryza meyeriana var. granulata]